MPSDPSTEPTGVAFWIQAGKEMALLLFSFPLATITEILFAVALFIAAVNVGNSSLQ